MFSNVKKRRITASGGGATAANHPLNVDVEFDYLPFISNISNTEKRNRGQSHSVQIVNINVCYLYYVIQELLKDTDAIVPLKNLSNTSDTQHGNVPREIDKLDKIIANKIKQLNETIKNNNVIELNIQDKQKQINYALLNKITVYFLKYNKELFTNLKIRHIEKGRITDRIDRNDSIKLTNSKDILEKILFIQKNQKQFNEIIEEKVKLENIITQLNENENENENEKQAPANGLLVEANKLLVEANQLLLRKKSNLSKESVKLKKNVEGLQQAQAQAQAQANTLLKTVKYTMEHSSQQAQAQAQSERARKEAEAKANALLKTIKDTIKHSAQEAEKQGRLAATQEAYQLVSTVTDVIKHSAQEAKALSDSEKLLNAISKLFTSTTYYKVTIIEENTPQTGIVQNGIEENTDSQNLPQVKFHNATIMEETTNMDYYTECTPIDEYVFSYDTEYVIATNNKGVKFYRKIPK